MKKLFLAILALVGVAAGPTSAADLGPAPAPVYSNAPGVEPPHDWTGFYLGAHALYGWSHNDFQTENIASGQKFAPGSNDTFRYPLCHHPERE